MGVPTWIEGLAEYHSSGPRSASISVLGVARNRPLPDQPQWVRRGIEICHELTLYGRSYTNGRIQEVSVGFGDWFKKLFFPAGATPPDVRRLSSASEGDLSSSLQSLPPGERGWIALREAAQLFSSRGEDYAFGEMDEEGKRRLAEFAAKCNCDFQFMPMEGRVYFTRR
jgi:hypothetical protein